MAIASASNTASSLRAPPPRMTTTASSGRQANSSMPRATIATARSPWTRTSHTVRRKPTPLLLQLVLEVVPGGAADARDDADAQRHRAQRMALVAVEVTGRRASRRSTWSRCWARSPSVKRGSMPPIFRRQPPRRGVEVEVAVDAHLHAVAEDEPVALEETAQPLALGGEEGHLDHGLRVGLVVGEGEVGVRPPRAPALDLAAHPDPVVEAGPQPRVDHLGELADGERALGLEVAGRAVSDPKSSSGCDMTAGVLPGWHGGATRRRRRRAAAARRRTAARAGRVVLRSGEPSGRAPVREWW